MATSSASLLESGFSGSRLEPELRAQVMPGVPWGSEGRAGPGCSMRVIVHFLHEALLGAQCLWGHALSKLLLMCIRALVLLRHCLSGVLTGLARLSDK